MADQKLSQLVEATSVGLTDVFLVVQGGVSKKVTKTNLFANLETLNVVGKVQSWKTFETLTNSGIVSTDLHVSFINNSTVSSTLAMTLAAGVEGMTKILACQTNLGTIGVTVTGGLGFTTITLVTHATITLHYVNGLWVVVSNNGATLA